MNWTAPQVSICPADPSCLAQAQSLSAQYGLPLIDTLPADRDSSTWILLVTREALTLSRPDGLSTAIDFVDGKATQRSQEVGFKSQPLARALGLRQLRKRKAIQPSIIDATAGFGIDGWMMASLDCDVRLLEASPVLSAMLTHALNAAGNSRPSGGLAQSISVVNINSTNYLMDTNNPGADIIYLDPMYPQSSSKALVKKGMQLLHDLIGPDTNDAGLLGAALARAEYRVVVKRPRGAPLLTGSENWSGQITDVQSPQTRFDIYHVARD